MAAPPTTAPQARRSLAFDQTALLPKMAATARGATADKPIEVVQPLARRPASQPAGGRRGSKYFVQSSPRSLSPRHHQMRRTPSPPVIASAGEGVDILTIRPVAMSGAAADEGPAAIQGSRLHFSTPLGRETSAGGTLYGPGSFATPEELRDFLTQADIDVSLWETGEAKGVYGLHRELEKRESTLEVQDRRVVRHQVVVKVRVLGLEDRKPSNVL